MLGALRIANLAVIESLEVELGPGFTVLTGETGAGKSILVDALTLVMGGRASADYIRTAAEAAEIEALFDLSDSPAAKKYLQDAGIIGEEGDPAEVVVRRIISRSGKNRAWINSKLESTATLFELGRLMVDIYGQHEYQSLLKPERHGRLLDSFGGLLERVDDYRKAYEHWRAKKSELAALDLDETGRAEREDMLRFRVNEIESAKLEPGEDQELARERELLRHAEALGAASRQGVEILYESDGAVVGTLQSLSDRLKDATRFDPELKTSLEQIEQAAAVLEDAASELRAYADRIEADPQRLQWVEDRLDAIRKLKRKYGETIEDILASMEEARSELEGLENRESRLEELRSQVDQAHERALDKAAVLTAERRKAARSLAGKVEKELSSLGMEKTRFEVRIEPAEDEDGLGPWGADRVEFFISPNPGEDLKPLAKIASGGELSRIMLALRVLLAGEGEAATLIFDEVDQGIGGAVAEAVGKKMKAIAANKQTLCVTHLPQIAAQADRHLLVEKRQEKQKTEAGVRELDRGQRIEEIGRMLAGKTVTDTARAHAVEMLGPAPGGERRVRPAKKRKSG